MQPLPLCISKTFSSPQKQTLDPSNTQPPITFPLAATNLLFISMGLSLLRIPYKWNHTVHGLVCLGTALYLVFMGSRLATGYSQKHLRRVIRSHGLALFFTVMLVLRTLQFQHSEFYLFSCFVVSFILTFALSGLGLVLSE